MAGEAESSTEQYSRDPVAFHKRQLEGGAYSFGVLGVSASTLPGQYRA